MKPASILIAFLSLGAAATHAADVEVHLIDAAGKPLANAVVYLEAPAGTTVPATPAVAKIDQVDKRFVPVVSVVRTGTSVEFPNSDNIRHSVYSFSKPKAFSLKLYSGKPSAPVVFDQAGVVVLGCNIHDAMTAWIAVVDTPYFARSNERGDARIANVPDGQYRLHAWHPGVAAEPEPAALDVPAVKSSTVRLEARDLTELLQHAHDDAAPH